MEARGRARGEVVSMLDSHPKKGSRPLRLKVYIHSNAKPTALRVCVRTEKWSRRTAGRKNVDLFAWFLRVIP